MCCWVSGGCTRAKMKMMRAQRNARVDLCPSSKRALQLLRAPRPSAAMDAEELEAAVDALLAPLSEARANALHHAALRHALRECRRVAHTCVRALQEQERAYFERLQAAGGAPGLAVRRCGAKGKGLFATRCVRARMRTSRRRLLACRRLTRCRRRCAALRSARAATSRRATWCCASSRWLPSRRAAAARRVHATRNTHAFAHVRALSCASLRRTARGEQAGRARLRALLPLRGQRGAPDRAPPAGARRRRRRL
jgi:hypothetical protein